MLEYWLALGKARVPQNALMAVPLKQEHCFAGGQGSRLEGHGKVDLSKVGGKMMFLGCTSSYQTGVK